MKHLFPVFVILLLSSSAYSQVTPAQRVGINTESPKATLHIHSADLYTNPLIVENEKGTLIKSFPNGGTTIGSDYTPPANGLYVSGTLRPENGIITPSAMLIVN